MAVTRGFQVAGSCRGSRVATPISLGRRIHVSTCVCVCVTCVCVCVLCISPVDVEWCLAAGAAGDHCTASAHCGAVCIILRTCSERVTTAAHSLLQKLSLPSVGEPGPMPVECLSKVTLAVCVAPLPVACHAVVWHSGTAESAFCCQCVTRSLVQHVVFSNLKQPFCQMFWFTE